MSPLRLSANLAESADEDDDPRWQDWLGSLPELVAELSERWRLRVGEPYEPGGRTAWVAPARNARGEDLVLKVGWRHTEAEHEAAAYRLWNGRGAARLYESHTFGDTSALLLERCVPGTPLGRAVPEPEQDRIVASLLRGLWQSPLEGHPFRPLSVMCDEWAEEFEEDPGDIDPGLARAGMELLRSLPRKAERRVLLCTDLHAGNILAARREPWLVIDPKPYAGDPAYDSLQHMLNCRERLASDPVGLARRMADLLELDAERVRLWLFARCVQQSGDWSWPTEVAIRLAP